MEGRLPDPIPRERGQAKRSRSAALELTLLTVLVMVAMLGSLTWLSFRWQRSLQLEEVRHGLLLAGNALQSSLRYGMMLNRRDEILASIERVARDTRIKQIRIINHRGQITMSTRDEDLNRRVDRGSAECTLCHGEPNSPAKPAIHASGVRTLVEDGVMHAFTPVLAEPGCINVACHQREASSKVLGVIDIGRSLKDVQADLNREQIRLAGFSIAAAALGGILLWFSLAQRFRRPMRDVLRGIRRVASGDLNHRIPTRTSDEFGELARSFNAMSERLAAVQHRLIQSERLISMGKLAAGVAHEINNPLTGILAYAEDLKEDAEPSDPRRKDYEVIVQEALRCRQIVRSLLDFARQDASSFVRVHAGDLIEKAWNVVARQAAFRNIAFERRVEEGLPAIEVDPTQIQQVLVNLIVNAEQAMPQGGTIVLAARRSEEGDQVEFQVKDQGHGISPEIRSHIFEPFFSTKGGETAGLGLAVCFGIVQQHGGTIDFHSEPGSGTTFRVLLPFARTSVRGVKEGRPHG
jgi:two-component system NtrC family sensor kinase